MATVSVLLAPHDEAFGDRIAGALARQGKEAKLITGEQADLFIDNGGDIDASIVVWSEAAMRLARLHTQARAALESGALIPVSVDGGKAPEGFESLPPIDLSNWRGDDEDPRWRFVLEALAIASEYSREAGSVAAPDVEPVAEQVAAEPPAVAAAASTELAPVDLSPPYSPKILPPDIADDEMRNIPTISQLQALQPLSAFKRKRDRATPPAKPRRFDPVAVAVAGVMILCLLTGAAIILGPSFLSPPSPASASEAPTDPVAPVTPRVEVATLEPAVASASEEREDPFVYGQDDGPSVDDPPLYDPYTIYDDNIEGYGEGDISYPESPSEYEYSGDSAADALHLAMLGGAPREIVPQPSLSAKIAATPRTPTLKPAPPATALPTVGALLAGMPELIDQTAEHFQDCASCPDMVVIAPGDFVMGPGAGERARPNEGPATRVALARGFALAAREVTFAEWDACVADGGCAGHKAEDFGWGRGDQPVVGVSFDDANNYAAWLSQKTGEEYRLPSEAEWEFAARGGRQAPFSFGEDLSPRNANYDARFAYRGKKGRWVGRPTAASRYPANAFGLFDMPGNVWEWTADCWRRSLGGISADGAPRAGACGARVLKGGAFNTGGWRLRAAHRIGKPAASREMEIGFRVARDL